MTMSRTSVTSGTPTVTTSSQLRGKPEAQPAASYTTAPAMTAAMAQGEPVHIVTRRAARAKGLGCRNRLSAAWPSSLTPESYPFQGPGGPRRAAGRPERYRCLRLERRGSPARPVSGVDLPGGGSFALGLAVSPPAHLFRHGDGEAHLVDVQLALEAAEPLHGSGGPLRELEIGGPLPGGPGGRHAGRHLGALRVRAGRPGLVLGGLELLGQAEPVHDVELRRGGREMAGKRIPDLLPDLSHAASPALHPRRLRDLRHPLFTVSCIYRGVGLAHVNHPSLDAKLGRYVEAPGYGKAATITARGTWTRAGGPQPAAGGRPGPPAPARRRAGTPRPPVDLAAGY